MVDSDYLNIDYFWVFTLTLWNICARLYDAQLEWIEEQSVIRCWRSTANVRQMGSGDFLQHQVLVFMCSVYPMSWAIECCLLIDILPFSFSSNVYHQIPITGLEVNTINLHFIALYLYKDLSWFILFYSNWFLSPKLSYFFISNISWHTGNILAAMARLFKQR